MNPRLRYDAVEPGTIHKTWVVQSFSKSMCESLLCVYVKCADVSDVFPVDLWPLLLTPRDNPFFLSTSFFTSRLDGYGPGSQRRMEVQSQPFWRLLPGPHRLFMAPRTQAGKWQWSALPSQRNGHGRTASLPCVEKPEWHGNKGRRWLSFSLISTAVSPHISWLSQPSPLYWWWATSKVTMGQLWPAGPSLGISDADTLSLYHHKMTV